MRNNHYRSASYQAHSFYLQIFQIGGDKRQISFRDKEGAIAFNGYEAARSIDNYQQLYQVYRSDSLLQQLHERFPMIAIWDDHEFSNDNYGAHSN